MFIFYAVCKWHAERFRLNYVQEREWKYGACKKSIEGELIQLKINKPRYILCFWGKLSLSKIFFLQNIEFKNGESLITFKKRFD